ncbi:hypothetical protein BDN72DRAFT_847354 [Pluteus cervinus]|uniref:Uncharacterized protein n=1 Tax=Pluteus cervinus TaxID=181527 RepID=A0ACD3ADT2_9AGAR|nr:hypothetical protein BDN72DRAFT_847354 [Pluteus cervinus]
MSSPHILHLVYVHGFQGSDASFQAFPTDMQTYLASQIHSDSPIVVRSSVYPTYKSSKPLSYAVKNFLEWWLSLQAPGPVILLGHSMGGLLAAEAALDSLTTPTADSSSASTSTPPRRIIGVIAFDTPFLGMHPHVVKSGILSLFAKKEDHQVPQEPTELALNPHPHVNMVDPDVTDDWEEFKRNLIKTPPKSPSITAEVTPQPTRSTNGSLSPTPTPATPPTSNSPSRPSNGNTNLWLSVTSLIDDPTAKWLLKHHKNPVGEGKKWVVEQLQFGGSMFDPNSLSTRYTKLVEWGQKGGLWVNYWTQAPPKVEPAKAELQGPRNQKGYSHSHSESLGTNELTPSSSFDSHSSASSAASTASSGTPGETKKKKKGHHFVVLPTGLGGYLGGYDRWESVVIEGVKDEVAAHTGIFIREQNLGYEEFVHKVAGKVLDWMSML